MIAKILQSNPSFDGVGYSDKKEMKEQAKLMSAVNFEAMPVSPGKMPDANDYTHYLQRYSSRNSVVKNKQFHASISAKGQTMNFEQLKNAARDYMKYMGYEKQPYLIYAHKDTSNNHVHIISTRIGEDGKKINDSFERMRSQSFVKEYLGIDYDQNVSGTIKEANKFKFQTAGQYLSILEQLGVKGVIKDNSVQLYKHGQKMQEIPLDDVSKYITKDYDKKRAKQFSAVFYKYSETLNKEEFTKAIKDKMGAQIIFHMAEDKEKPYGFTVIDNLNKQAFKGSQILKIDQLIERFDKVEKRRESFDLNGFISSAVDSSESFKELTEKLSKEGLSVDNKGAVSYKNGNEIGYSLEDQILKDLKYQDRLAAAKYFSISDHKEKDLLGKIFFLRKEDVEGLKLDIAKENKHGQSYYEILIETLSANQEPLKDQLKDLKMELIEFKGEYFIIDTKDKNISRVELEFSREERENIRQLDSYFDSNKGNDFEKGLISTNLSEDFYKSGIVNALSSLLYYASEEDPKQSKKKKRGITR